MARTKYMEERFQKMLNSGKTTKKNALADKKKKADFFVDAIKKAPKKCQECGEPLAGTIAINPAAVVAHILPKRENGGCPSVAAHPLNKVYLCGDCHTDMDNMGGKKGVHLKLMKIYPLMRERVAAMWPEIAEHEKKNVPDTLKP